MKKKKGSISLLSVFGIGAIFGIFIALSDALVTVISFEREWITYALLFTLLVMSFQISLLWLRSNKSKNAVIDTDEAALSHEKLAYKFIGFTSLFLIIGSSTLFLVLLEWIDSGKLFSGPIAYSLAATLILYFYGIFVQIKAVKFHNKYNPAAFINWKRTDGYKEYFDNLDEGEKYEQYRVAHKSFYSMNILFPAVLILLLIISQASSPQFIAIGFVGALWFVMYMIYYREGYKTYK